jgi:hypothetical protein
MQDCDRGVLLLELFAQGAGWNGLFRLSHRLMAMFHADG